MQVFGKGKSSCEKQNERCGWDDVGNQMKISCRYGMMVMDCVRRRDY
jgi:hypothetical protein